jgi:hypothetical protein
MRASALEGFVRPTLTIKVAVNTVNPSIAVGRYRRAGMDVASKPID